MPINRTGLPHAVASTSQTQEALTSQASGAKESSPQAQCQPSVPRPSTDFLRCRMISAARLCSGADHAASCAWVASRGRWRRTPAGCERP